MHEIPGLKTKLVNIVSFMSTESYSHNWFANLCLSVTLAFAINKVKSSAEDTRCGTATPTSTTFLAAAFVTENSWMYLEVMPK